ncbi:meiosis-specific with OB domain-containing protein [Protopterus annectens]|uniref:meiosis-specific with OB domain-containing protein n=1 Tax=Protopterus annectens TaxID=7888 RepID=UPI001CFA4518|nr:meiosis-specific with OB domain-containing protein [Protopterus annectens]
MAFHISHRPVPISDLHPSLISPSVKGVIIGKTDARGFPDRKNFGEERYTFSFTVRDSPGHFINASCWGKEEYIRSLAASFRIGDCVVIENPLVQTKDIERDERFCPATSSYYKLSVSEMHSSVSVCSSLDVDTELLSLLYLPVKEPHDYYSLGDIVANGQSFDGKIINILAAVRLVGETKNFITSDNRNGQRCEIKLFDETVSSFPMICWDKESILLAQTWLPGETVIFASDIRVGYDSYRHCMTATIISKSIVTTNPDTDEANQLFNYIKEYAASGGFENEDDVLSDTINICSITDVYNVRQLKQKAQENGDKSDPVYGIVYAFISTLNIDSEINKIIRTRCVKCRFQIDDMSNTCKNPSCENAMNVTSSIASFELLVDVSDHTGTLQFCNLSGNAAEKTLDCTVDGFLRLTEEQKTALKWKLLLERCKIYLKIFTSSSSRTGLRINVLSCKIAEPEEASQILST